MIFIGILGVIAVVLLWDIYKQLRYLNGKIGLLIEKMQGSGVVDLELE